MIELITWAVFGALLGTAVFWAGRLVDHLRERRSWRRMFGTPYPGRHERKVTRLGPNLTIMTRMHKED